MIKVCLLVNYTFVLQCTTVHCNDKRKIYCIFGDFGAFPSAAWIKRNIKPQELLEGMKQPSTTTFYIEE